MNEMQSKQRDFSLTFIQVICAISVVTLHTNDCFWSFSATERYWFTANIIECVCYFAVPIFFMITGITLLDYQEKYSTKIFFKKRVEKALVPYLVWSFIGVAFLLLTKSISIENITAKWILNGLLSTEGIIIWYWFFRPLFCVYLSIPLFAAVEKNKKREIVKYLLVVCFIVNILLPFLNSVLKLDIEWPYKIEVVSGYLFWVLMGYYINYNPPTRQQKVIIYVLAFFGLMLHIVGTYVLSVRAGGIQTLYKGYSNVPCVLYTIGVFVFLRDISRLSEKVGWLKSMFMTMGKYTFPVYLIHWFILRIFNSIVAINTKSIFYRLLTPIVIYIIIMALVWCMRKVPWLRKIVP